MRSSPSDEARASKLGSVVGQRGKPATLLTIPGATLRNTAVFLYFANAPTHGIQVKPYENTTSNHPHFEGQPDG